MEPVILVGHSVGGLVISQVAERDPTKIEKLVYLTAYLFQDSEYLFQKVSIGAASPLVVDEAGTCVTIRAEMLKDFLYADCSEDDIERAAALLVPEAITLGTDLFMSPRRGLVRSPESILNVFRIEQSFPRYKSRCIRHCHAKGFSHWIPVTLLSSLPQRHSRNCSFQYKGSLPQGLYCRDCPVD